MLSHNSRRTIGSIASDPNLRLFNRRARLSVAVHAVRIGLLVLLVFNLYHSSLNKFNQAGKNSTAIEVESIRGYLPDASAIGTTTSAGQFSAISGKSGQVIGAAATTSPVADQVVGYTGPSNTLIVLDAQQRIVGTQLLTSRDTADHVRLVEQSPAFWRQFLGWQVGALQTKEVDGVSGATLTSLAIAESIILRLQGVRRSLRFPDDITLDELHRLGQTVARIEPELQFRGAFRMLDEQGQFLRMVVRTGDWVDSIEGYQGPSELLLFFDAEQRLVDVKLRSSFDNQPYIRYVQQEYSFWSKFKGKSWQELATLDFSNSEIEGVSGATMTSMAAARIVKESSRQLLERESNTGNGTETRRPLHLNFADVTTAALILLALIWSRSRLRTNRRLRVFWQCLCLVFIGIVSGNVLSMALLSGWIQGGIPYRLAPGLTLIFLVAYLHPLLFKGNLYCDHICPHGILQQWMARCKGRNPCAQPGLKPLPVIQWTQIEAIQPAASPPTSSAGRAFFSKPTGKSIKRFMTWSLPVLAWSMILAVFLAIDGNFTVDAASMEPFDAYSWRLGWSFSMLVWLLSLVMAWYFPMSYCRLACPTGKTLDYVRSGPDRWRMRSADILLIALLAYSWLGG